MKERGSRRVPYIDRPWAVWAVRVFVLLFVAGAWEIYGRSVSRAFFAPLSVIAQQFMELVFIERVIPVAIIETNVSLALGFGLAIVLGTAVGLVMGRWELVNRLFSPYVSFLYTLPRIALIPVLILWLGIDEVLRVAIVFLASVFPIIINTAAGVKEIDEELRDVARVARASSWQELHTVTLPGSLPFVLVGYQNGLAHALIAAIVAEMTAILTGLGGLVRTYANFFQTANMFVPIVIIAVESVLLVFVMKWLRSRLAPWSLET